jgi:hypothetical protein
MTTPDGQRFVKTPREFERWLHHSGLTKDQLAKTLGVTRQTLHNWTVGRASNEIKKTGGHIIEGDTQYARIPVMLSLSLYAIDHMPREFAVQELGQSHLINKR